MAAGDHVFVQCFGYSHHGIDVGDGHVVHFDFTPKRKLAGWFGGRRAEIVRSTAEAFSGGREIKNRQYRDDEHCLPPKTTVRRALDCVGPADYNLLFNNCEHFAQWCKTGDARSTQVDTALESSRPLAAGSLVAGLLRWNPLVPLPIRVATSGIAVGFSLGCTAWKYAARRQADLRESRSSGSNAQDRVTVE